MTAETRTVGALKAELETRGLLRDAGNVKEDEKATGLEHDSRSVRKGNVFFALRGAAVDGHMFIDKAVEKGAIAIVCEQIPRSSATAGVTWLRVTSARKAFAWLAGAWFGHPARDLQMIAVTGTNGKTTVTTLVYQMLQRLGYKAGLIGTVSCRIGNRELEVPLTTPDPVPLHDLFAQMRDDGCTTVAMEVSSHALDQDRVYGIPYMIAVFTNLTRDHLDYHGTEEQYLEAKKRLFDGLQPDSFALLNRDDPSWKALSAGTRASVFTYGLTEDADYYLEIVRNEADGLVLRGEGAERRFRLIGQYNASNLVASYGVGALLGLGREKMLDALSEAEGPRGRFERIELGGELTAVVDYAHTPDALRNVLTAVRRVKPADAQAWSVFGCGGDRDRGKRPMMGTVAEENADRIVVTSDNPRTEDPVAILDDIRQGMKHPERAEWIPSRREAIRFAIRHASPGDIVLVSGKGNENYQEIGTEKLPFDDVYEIEQAYELRKSEQTGQG